MHGEKALQPRLELLQDHRRAEVEEWRRRACSLPARGDGSLDKHPGCQEGEKSELRGLQKVQWMGLLDELRGQESVQSPLLSCPWPPWGASHHGALVTPVQNEEVGPSNLVRLVHSV